MIGADPGLWAGLIGDDDVRDMLAWENSGFSLDASVRIADRDRAGLERLLRYCARPPFALERLDLLDEQRVIYRLPKPQRNGATALTLTPLELIATLESTQGTQAHRSPPSWRSPGSSYAGLRLALAMSGRPSGATGHPHRADPDHAGPFATLRGCANGPQPLRAATGLGSFVNLGALPGLESHGPSWPGPHSGAQVPGFPVSLAPDRPGSPTLPAAPVLALIARGDPSPSCCCSSPCCCSSLPASAPRPRAACERACRPRHPLGILPVV